MHFIKFASLGIFNAHFLLILETPYGYRVDEGVYDMEGGWYGLYAHTVYIIMAWP